MKELNIHVDEMSKKITTLYNSGEVNKQLFRSLVNCFSNGDFKTVAIYLYKRHLLELNVYEIREWLERNRNTLSKHLFISFMNKVDNNIYSDITMYIIKNDYIAYMKGGERIHNVISKRRELLKSK